jgi:hypothetical protein
LEVPGTNYEFALGSFEFPPEGSVSTDALLTAIVTWLSDNFDLPAVYDPPRIVPMSSAAMANLLYQRFLGDKYDALSGPEHQGQSYQRRRVESLYSVAKKTIYLPPEWTGGTPAKLSMLVHEMVHHLQNVAHIDYACPQQREKLAYEAQEKWLTLSGLSLASEFGLDRTTIVLTTACMG